MIIPIKKIILEMSTALKRRKAFQQAGIIPPKNEYGYNFPQKKIFKKIINFSKCHKLPANPSSPCCICKK